MTVAASFDCDRAATETEIAICNDPELSALDELMGALWVTLDSSESAMVEQREWLEQRDNCGANKRCITTQYMSQFQKLGRGVVGVLRHQDQGPLEYFLVDSFPNHSLTPTFILQRWPVCMLWSSLGQKCRAYWESEVPNGILDVLSYDGYSETPTGRDLNIEISNNTLSITDIYWFYSFEINTLGAGQHSVRFVDDALQSTYFSSTEYSVNFNNGLLIIQHVSTETW